MNGFTLTDYDDSCLHYERADGYVIDHFIPLAGGDLAVLVGPQGDVIDYYGNAAEAAAWANILEQESAS